jgi:Signal peptidase, peptidase S26
MLLTLGYILVVTMIGWVYQTSDPRVGDIVMLRYPPRGYYFAMADHRTKTSDSRRWGMIPKKYTLRGVQSRCWPLSTARSF